MSGDLIYIPLVELAENGKPDCLPKLVKSLEELLEHGYGRLEICVQDGKVVNFQVTKSFK